MQQSGEENYRHEDAAYLMMAVHAHNHLNFGTLPMTVLKIQQVAPFEVEHFEAKPYDSAIDFHSAQPVSVHIVEVGSKPYGSLTDP